jgi:hypothetical protein
MLSVKLQPLAISGAFLRMRLIASAIWSIELLGPSSMFWVNQTAWEQS